MNPTSPALCWLLLAASTGLPTALPAQDDPALLERLRGDQDAILRKAERLQGLMQRLQQRYQRENKPEQVKLLVEGLAHLDRSGILRDIASIRDDLAATALTEALRKQKDVVDDLERLLAILLERNSIENLQQELAKIEAEAKTARELADRQRELMERTAETMRTPPTPAEQALLDRLAELQRQQRTEAERNMRQAGARRPFLESALERVRELLASQQQLEAGIADEQSGRTPVARAAGFDLGELTQRVKELSGELRDQAKTQALGDDARALQKEAAGADQAAAQQARDRFAAGLREAPKRGTSTEGKATDPDWAKVRERLQAAGEGATPAERDELAKVGEAGSELAGRRDQEARTQNTKTGQSLADAAAKVAERLRTTAAGRATPADPKTDPAAAVAEAQQRLTEAATASETGDLPQAQKKVNEAMAALDRAQQEHQRQNPDAARKAAEMAAEAASTAQELHNAPAGETAEQQAGGKLDEASKALRDVAAASEQAERASQDNRNQAAATSKQALQDAEHMLQEALQRANQGNQQDQQDAAARQQQLATAAKAAAEQAQVQAQRGNLSKAQAEQAQQGLQQAQERMQAAAGKLQQGQQASAATDQAEAADAIERAMQGLDQKRPPTQDQQQQLQQQAKAQQELAEDIIALAKELKQRDNKAAQRKVDAAADAAKKAQRAMEQGDPEETQQQQEQARQNLEDAAKELEEEKDRYQDLRQEELLFRMKDELQQFLERQRPITAQTVEAQKSLTAEGLARAVRRKLNQLGEEEQELSGKLDFLVAALTEEGNLVYQTVLKANVEDLEEVARRLSGRNPDVGSFTTLLQQDVERRSEELLKALERERQRRDQQRREQQQQQQQDKGKNRFDPQRQKLVSLIAELEMLKQLGIDTRTAADNLRALVESRADDVIADVEVAMIERLANRHGEITKLFQQIKAGVEATLQQMQGNQEDQGGGRGR
ncbi:MAG: hypothetical protein WAT39_20010 [Planctomycetota bacterium]